MNGLAALDFEVFRWLQMDAHEPVAFVTLGFVTSAFDALWAASVVAALVAWLAGRPSRRAAWVLGAYVVAAVLVVLLKGVVGRGQVPTLNVTPFDSVRAWLHVAPRGLVAHEDGWLATGPAGLDGAGPAPLARLEPARALAGFVQRALFSSFPSGHAARAWAFAVAAGALFPRWRWPLVALAAVVAFSRAYCGYHWPLDVVAGAALGAGVGWAAVLARRRATPGSPRRARRASR